MSEDFDPAAYAKDNGDFDPAAYAKEHELQTPPQEPTPQNESQPSGMVAALNAQKRYAPSEIAKAVAIGALPPAVGATWDVAGKLARDLPSHLVGRSAGAEIHDIGDLLNAWRESQAQRRGWLERAREEHPVATAAGQMAALAMPGTALAKAMAPAAAVPGALGHAAELTNLASQSAMGRAAYGDQATPTDILGDVVTGQVLGSAVSSLAAPLKRAGALLQKPQEWMESAADKLGGTKLGQMLAGKEVAPIGESVASARVSGLRHTIDVADLGRQTADDLSDAIRQLGGLGSKRIAALSQTERGQVAEQLASLWQKKGANVDPATLVRNWDELAPSLFLNAEKDSVQSLLRGVNTRDVGYLAALGANIAKRAKVLGTQPNMVQPARQMLEGAEASHNEFLVGKMTRAGEPAVNGQGQFQVQPGQMQTPQDRLANGLAQSAQRGESQIDLMRSPEGVQAEYSFPAKEFAGDFSAMSKAGTKEILDRHAPQLPGENMDVIDRLDLGWEAAHNPTVAFQEAKTGRGPRAAEEISAEAVDRWNKIKADFNERHSADREAVFERARAIRELLEQHQALKQQEARDQLAGRAASDELRRIETGRQALANALGVAGAAKGGLGLGGLGGAVLGLALGKPLGKTALKTVDLAGLLGQRLSSGEPAVNQQVLPTDAALVRLAEILRAR